MKIILKFPNCRSLGVEKAIEQRLNLERKSKNTSFIISDAQELKRFQEFKRNEPKTT